MSLISASRSLPAVWIVCANSICFSLRLPSSFCASRLERIRSELSGVRSSCDMFARNSLLYLELTASCSAFSSRLFRASSISRFLISMSRFCCCNSAAFSWSSSLVCCSSSCWVCRSSSDAFSDFACSSSSAFERFSSSCCDWSSSDCDWSSCVSAWDCSSSSSVRMLAMIVESTTPIVSISWSRNCWWVSEKTTERRQLDDPEHLLLEEHRQDDDVLRRRVAEAGRDLDVVRGRLGQEDRLLLERRLADERLARLELVRDVLALLVAVARHELQLDLAGARTVAVPGLREEERAVLRGDRRGQLRHDQPRDGLEVALALHEARDASEVGLEPVLLLVALGRLAQVRDHLVDVVLSGPRPRRGPRR